MLSTQVLREFYVNVTAKIPKPISPGEARAVISRYLVWPVEANTAGAVIRASEIQERHRPKKASCRALPGRRNQAAMVRVAPARSRGNPKCH